MHSLLQSSLHGHDFIKYRQHTTRNEREQFSNYVRVKGVGNLPVVIDSVDSGLSELLAGGSRGYGKAFKFHQELSIEDILLEVKYRIKSDNTKILKLGLENGKILNDKDILGDVYKKYKHQSDNILYLLLTQETSMYGYIISLLRYIFGPHFMKK